jgi:hypothetical protein
MISIEEQLTIICKHNREKKECKTCRYYCQHNKNRYKCVECGGSQICQHKRERSKCVECGSGSVCQHKKIRSVCIKCGGGSICPHKRVRSSCMECGGSQICQHKRLRFSCIECGGSSICQHNKVVRTCQICEPIKYIINLQRHQIWRIMQQTNLEKTQPSIEYLGCSAVYFKEYISKKMTVEMTFENIHYDHIKPVSVFDLNDPDELLKCCHYTNFQPLLATDNLEKSNKWNDECEAFWRQNICGKEYFEIYNPFNS